MGETRPLLLAAVICILLTNQTVLTNSSPTDEQTRQDVDDTGQEDSTNENLRINATVIDGAVFFNWSLTYNTMVRYKTKFLACEYKSKFTNWSQNENVKVKVMPYSNVTVEVLYTLQSNNNTVTNHTRVKSHFIPGKEPNAKVTRLQKIRQTYEANIENECIKYNGNEMKVLFVLKELNEPKHSDDIEKIVNIENNIAKLKLGDLKLLAFTDYRVTAFPANDFGSNTSIGVKQEANFTTKSEKPSKVRNLTVTDAAPYCLKVEWNLPNDDPPKGILEKFTVTWFNRMTTATEKENNTNTTHLYITGLDPNTEYNITVKAKNKDVNQDGDSVSVIGNTTEERDPSPVNIMSTDETSKTTLHLSWNPPLMDEIANYMVSLNEFKIMTKTNNITFDNLTAGTRYTVQVEACTKCEKCSIKEADVWTRPEKPKVKETMQVPQATDTTITIQLPTLENPPGYHWVLLKKDDTGSDVTNAARDIKNRAKEIVLEEKQIRHKRTVRSIHKEKLRFVTVMEVKGDEEAENTLIVGDGSTEENGPLESGTQFAVVIVTEKKAGNYSEYYASEPIRYYTKFHQEFAMLGIIGGICVCAVILITIVTLLIMGSMKQRRKPSAVNDNQCFIAGDPFIYETVCEDDTIPSENGMAGAPMLTKEGVGEEGLHQKNIEEDVYANISHEINREDLEMYLPKAMFSVETTMDFSSVPFFMPGKTYSESRVPENVPKNRYRNEISYDDTRVKLPFYNNIPYSDYINANFVQDPLRHKAFIATQGPKDHNADTIGAFWRMIWHTNCSIILMVANLVEGGRVKVAKYWPETEPLVKEGVKVTLTSVRIVMDFAVRTFTMVADNMEREVTQYHYIAWPDHGVPQIAYGLSQMLRAVIKHYGQGLHGPITVHCSAGIGRTGTIILTLYLLRQLDAFNAVNPRKALQAMRMGRGHLVENKEQYIFVHKLLQAILFETKMTFPCNSFVKELAALRSSKGLDGTLLLQKEFKKIKNLPKDLTFKKGKDPTCAHLNRNQAILPADNRMVFVQIRSGDSQYLNIIRINGFDKKDAYLAGEHPQSTTLAKVWRLVLERRVPVWLLLQEFPHNDPLFPDVVSKSSPLPQYMTLEVSEPRHLENFTEYSVSITVKDRVGIASHKCTLLMLKGWSHAAKLPSSPTALLGAIEKVESILSPENPLLFTCSDGVSGCGVMAALLLAVSRAKLTQEVDVYHSTVSVQYDRPQFILDFEQYQFLYKAMETFLDGNKHYGNFA